MSNPGDQTDVRRPQPAPTGRRSLPILRDCEPRRRTVVLELRAAARAGRFSRNGENRTETPPSSTPTSGPGSTTEVRPSAPATPAPTTPAPSTPPPATSTPTPPPPPVPATTPVALRRPARTDADPRRRRRVPLRRRHPFRRRPGPCLRRRRPQATAAGGRNINPLLALATAILLITTIIFGLMALAPRSRADQDRRTHSAPLQADTEKESKTVAPRFTENLLTYKYQTVSTRLRARAQGRDARVRDAQRSTRSAAATSPRLKCVTVGTRNREQVDVKGAAITSRDADTATVLVVSCTGRSTAHHAEAPVRRLLVIELTLREHRRRLEGRQRREPGSAS